MASIPPARNAGICSPDILSKPAIKLWLSHVTCGNLAAMGISIRASLDDDLPGIQAIYELEVLEGTASFELEPPAVEEMQRRRQQVLAAGLPYLVATEGEAIAGFCYVTPYRTRPAYRFTLENSVYVASWARRRGVGYSLLEALIGHLEGGEWRQIIAVIGGSEHLASIHLHEQAGFEHVGVLKSVGFKFDKWVDSVIMQREISSRAGT